MDDVVEHLENNVPSVNTMNLLNFFIQMLRVPGVELVNTSKVHELSGETKARTNFCGFPQAELGNISLLILTSS